MKIKGTTLKILFILVLGLLLASAVILGYKNRSGTSLTSMPTLTPTVGVKSKDLGALEKYCMEEVLRLPRPQFTYKVVEGPTRSGPMVWVGKYYPKELKESEKISCTLAYRFEGRPAYGSVNTTYPSEGEKFSKRVYEGFSVLMTAPWGLVKGENNIYKRENMKMGTVDFVDIFDGGLTMFVKFNTYYK